MVPCLLNLKSAEQKTLRSNEKREKYNNQGNVVFIEDFWCKHCVYYVPHAHI